MKIAVFAGDGIGPEVTAQALRVLDVLALPDLTLFEGDVGAIAYRRHGHPLPQETIDMAKASDAVLFGAVGDPSCDDLPRAHRPEQAILGLRKELDLFANLRPARTFDGLEHLSPLGAERALQFDMMIVRELTGDVYFGEKGERKNAAGEREGWDMMSYSESEIRRIANIAFDIADQSQSYSACIDSVDKANVLETSRVWREVVTEVAKERWSEMPPLRHMYVDNAAMQMVTNPNQFGVILTGNLFGDILSDLASACVGSIGLLASASLGERQTEYGTFGLYEPIHGSAPDIAGQGKANPVAAVLSLAMLLRHSLGREAEAVRVEHAVEGILADGVFGGDLGGSASTEEIGDAIVRKLLTIS
ncbi:3-isopropylmalate dehydrogenase [Qipengyuania sp. 6B39]|uniref:3-isopropylmalate dehydrogenase n=1 Tax=Qipengyuania proteolytica TaxID=2867239 RepID=UPI001C898401|nr:3-isopropylmalate dehydrogenase [Qipengyuania proteolytica]MBX7496541.1 3-isopropylmalate dehydrogenase [Qipengyuania proteolytica]